MYVLFDQPDKPDRRNRPDEPDLVGRAQLWGNPGHPEGKVEELTNLSP